MRDNEEMLLDPSKQLLFAVSNTHKIPGSLSEEIETLENSKSEGTLGGNLPDGGSSK